MFKKFSQNLKLLSLSIQAVLDCPLEILNRYVTEYEPYLKDPVGFPKVMVSTHSHILKEITFRQICLRHTLLRDTLSFIALISSK